MAIMTWQDDYSVFVEEIDEQHKKLIDLINIMHQAMKDGKGREFVSQTISELIDYTGYHFSTEEKYMKQFNYPEYEQHKGEHEKFVEKVLYYKNNFVENKISMTVEVFQFLCGWLKNHIAEVDKKMGPYLNQQGLK